MFYLCTMEDKIFKYSLTEKNAEGEEVVVSKAAVFIREIINSAIEQDTLYLFLKPTTRSMQLVKAPQKVKITKENPIGWVEGIEKREMEEQLTLKVTNAEDIARWEAYIESISI